jgi:hypothetical protein
MFRQMSARELLHGGNGNRPGIERFAWVMSVLEGQSDEDCAILLR